MKAIATLVDLIRDELSGAKQYAELSIKWKADHPKTAEKMHELAGVELTHARALHTEAERLIEEERTRNGEPPAGMLAVYNYEHQRLIRQAAETRALVDEYDS